jgi:hypothetical protein
MNETAKLMQAMNGKIEAKNASSAAKEMLKTISNLNDLEKWRNKDKPSEDLYMEVRGILREKLGLTR